MLAHAPSGALAPLLGGALPSSPQRDERSPAVAPERRWRRWTRRSSLTGLEACSLRCSGPPCHPRPGATNAVACWGVAQRSSLGRTIRRLARTDSRGDSNSERARLVTSDLRRSHARSTLI